VTALRPERASGGAEPSRSRSSTSWGSDSGPEANPDPSSYDYESTGEFAAAVEGLADPLNDPLPARVNPSPAVTERTAEGSPWFRPSPQPQTRQGSPYGTGSGTGAGVSGGAPGLPPEWQLGPGDVSTDGYPQPGRQEPGQQPQRQPYDAAHQPWASDWTADAPDTPAGKATDTLPLTTPPARPSPGGPEPESGPAAGQPDAGRWLRAGGGGDTAVMPSVDPGADESPARTPDGAPQAPGPPQPGRAARRRAAAAAGAGGAGAAAEAGGRAARRRAAQQASRRGGRRALGNAAPSGGAAFAQSAAADGPEAPTAPRSRVEARRAARAAKESPGVIASRIAGEVFITFGVLMLLFVTYQLWWSNILAHQEAGGAANSLLNQWNRSNGDRNATFTDGQNFAIIYIPNLDVKAPIAQGVSKPRVLDKGMVGHYDGAPFDTAMPWDRTGNFALAAHRNTHGEPFRYINKLVKGDKVVVETGNTYYTYEVTSGLPQTSPSNVSVIEPIPTGSGFTRPGRYITLTTCTPEFTSTYRLIVWGKMVSEQPRSKGTPAVLQGG
jgi:sortase A